MLLVGERVHDRDRRGLRPFLELRLRERANRDRVEIRREHACRVGERLAARELQLLGLERDRRAAELCDRNRERDARARRRLLEQQAERASRQPRLVAVELELGCEVEHRFRLGGREIGGAQEVATCERDGERAHDQRSCAAATAAPTSGKRCAGSRRLERPRAHRGSDLLVGIAERHALAHERFRRVGREQQRIRRGLREPVAIELEPAHEHPQRAERARDVAPRREHRRLVLLQVAVVRERQALDRREQTR